MSSVTNERERRAHEAREALAKQQAVNNQADWDRYVNARIERYLSLHRAEAPSDTLPEALHEALGQKERCAVASV